MIYNYSKKEIVKNVKICLGILLKHDSFLLKMHVNERSVSHKLAEYLQIQFPDWNVDCEYNRSVNDTENITKMLHGVKGCTIDKDTDRVIPDIIIHQRGTNYNFLVIEMKIRGDDPCDIVKLEKFTSLKENFKYKLGLFIKFNSENKPELRWFENEKEIPEPI